MTAAISEAIDLDRSTIIVAQLNRHPYPSICDACSQACSCQSLMLLDINRDLEAKTRALAGWKGYTTNLTTQTATFVIDAYHQLWRIEKAFPNVQACPTSPPGLSPPA